MIRLTRDYMRRQAAAAVPGAYFDGEWWTLPEPTPRSAVVALKLFPELLHSHPELVEMRDSIIQNAKPVDYASQCNLRIGAPRVRAEMAKRGWSLSKALATPVDAGEDFQEIDLGYIAAVLKQHGGAYLGWSRGFGKTLGTAAIIDELDCQATLVIAPNSAKAVTWADELEWACPWLTILTLPNDAKKRDLCLARAAALDFAGTPFVLVVHFEALAIIAGKTEHRAKGSATHSPGGYKRAKPGRVSNRLGDGWRKLGIEWDLKAADEGHRLANPDSLMSRAAAKIPARMRMVMSGSVFMNRFEELYGPLRFLYPEHYKSRWRDWNNRYGDYVENGYGKICVGILEHKVEAMRDELGRFMVVRDKKSKAVMQEVRVDLSTEQRRVYDELADTLLAELPNGERVKSSTGIALLTRLRQVATGLDLLSEDVSDSTKLEAVVDTIRATWDRGDTYVCFGWYRASARALEQRLADAGIEAWLIDGDVPQKKRAEIVRSFQSGQRRVLIGTLATVSESLNLQVANHVIRIDRSWVPATNQQAQDRCDRQGQTREVYVTDVVANQTVDDLVVMPSIVSKEAMRQIIFGGAA